MIYNCPVSIVSVNCVYKSGRWGIKTKIQISGISLALYKSAAYQIYGFPVVRVIALKRKRPYVRGWIGGLNMKNRKNVTQAGQDYTKAYNMHYKTKDLPKAFKLYRGIILDYPETEEAGYSLSQVKNIVNEVVPKQEVMDTLVALTLTHFEQDVPSDTKSNSDASLDL